MQELTDDQLDGLFRKSAEEFEPPYEPAAWEAMTAQLDDRDRAAFWKKWLPRSLPVLLLLLMGSVWYIYQQTRPDAAVRANGQLLTATEARPPKAAQSVSLQQEEAPKAMPEPKRLAGSVGKETDEQPDRTLERNATETKPEQRIPAEDRHLRPDGQRDQFRLPSNRTKTHQPAVTTAVPRIGNDRTQIAQQAGLATSEQAQLAATDRVDYRKPVVSGRKSNRYVVSQPVDVMETANATSRAKRWSAASEPVIANPSITDGRLLVDPIIAPTEAKELMAFTLFPELPVRPGKWMKMPKEINREISGPEKQAPVVVATTTPQSGLSVRLAVSPDLSAIGLHNFSRPGTSLGALLEYRMSSRWSVQAGVIWSLKIYRADSSEYRGNDSYWAKFSTRPNEVSGQCNMLDIPINVRYDVLLRPRLDTRLPPSRWFVSGGITSYITLKEDYSYEYPPHTYNVPYSWRAPSGSYGFSQLNLSAGYERAVSRRLSWQVEPFMKVPLKGVGYFKVDLLSTGAFLSVRYKL
ncbi:hypothetical protein WBJ53_29310 [Spirosoma sp. SC4-14]|uniref:hypothetical protein n=1 Tax=Spirosoma sp. SC4-14 TaxID=3128900 RepID=UPI0030CE551D